MRVGSVNSIMVQSTYNDDTSICVESDYARNSIDLSGQDRAKKYFQEAYDVTQRLLQNCDEDFASSP